MGLFFGAASSFFFHELLLVGCLNEAWLNLQGRKISLFLDEKSDLKHHRL